MHSRIFEVSEKPVDPENYLDEGSIPEWFCGSIADYVDGDTDRDHDIEWLLQQMHGAATYSVEDNSLSFDADAKKKFFAADYLKFQESLKELSCISEEEFAGESHDHNLRLMMYRLKEAYADKFGFYICSEERELEPLHDWLRMADLSKKYYIGGTIDYHF